MRRYQIWSETGKMKYFACLLFLMALIALTYATTTSSSSSDEDEVEAEYDKAFTVEEEERELMEHRVEEEEEDEEEMIEDIVGMRACCSFLHKHAVVINYLQQITYFN